MDTEERTNEPMGRTTADHAPVQHYEIRVRGHLSPRWMAWFDGLTLTNEDDGTTVMRGPVIDQAALHGLLQKLRDLGVALLSLTRTVPAQSIDHPVHPHSTNHHETPGANP